MIITKQSVSFSSRDHAHQHLRASGLFLLCLLLFILLFPASVIPVSAAEASGKVTVRVGYLQMQGFLYQEADGSFSGLAYDMLQEIGAYNNWTYEFVECGYSEIESFFAADQIDLFIPYQRTSARMQFFEYSNEVFCTNKATLLTLPDNPIDYDDFEDLDGCTIGVLKGTRNGERFQEYLAEHGCSVTLKKDYVRRQELLDAIQSGEIDAFVSASNRGITDYQIVGQLPQTDSYVVAPKGNRTFLDSLDHAIEKINIEMPYLLSSLEVKYQNTTEGRYPSISEEERAYAQTKKQVSVLISKEECDVDGNFSGSAKVLFDHIRTFTDMEFLPIVADSTTQIMSDITAGKADIIYTFNRDFDWADQHNVWLTCSYSDFYNKLITKSQTSAIHTVSVVPGSYIAYWIEHNTDYAIEPCASYAACIDAVLDGSVDATYCNSPIGNYYSTFPKYSRLSFLTAFDMESSYCIGVSKSSDQMLVDILNKAILCIPEATLRSAYETQMNSRSVSLMDFFYTSPLLAIGIIIVCLVILLTFLFTIFYARRIRRKNAQLAIANGAKTDFMSRMSHDMRTPMNGILGLVQLTRDEKDPSVVNANLDQIELSGQVLLDLINDTLDMNKIEAGKLELHPKPVNSEEVFGNVLTTAGIMTAEKGLQLKLDVPQIAHDQWIPVLADASRLEQILFNIISNAVKFTPSGGTIELKMRTLKIDENYVHDQYTITDTGIGMSPEFVPHLFDAFSQENQDSRDSKTKDQGTGLGMSIVKQLITLMGGEIDVQSALHKGTSITLTMHYPIYHGTLDSPADPTSDMAVSLEQLQGIRVLLCEDHPINAQIATKLLSKKGILVDLAENGEIGLKKFQASAAHTYAVILMDIRMPIMDGLETTRAIRALDRTDAATIPIIAMTANAFEEDVQRCTEAGINDHLAKPYEAATLYRVIARHLSDH